jgi:putative phage-type endonuclease
MSLTQEELERRRSFLTATDVPAILGQSPWVNAADVFLQKTQGISTFKGNDATDAGTILEPAVLAWAAMKLGPLNPGDWIVHENGINACSLDAQRANGEVVEAKTTGIVGPGAADKWGEEGTDEIPDYYLLQVQAQLMITGAARAWVPALIGGRGFVMFVVMANRDLQEVIAENSVAFWQEHVIPKIAPPDVRPSLEFLKAMRREPDKIVPVDSALAEQYMLDNEAKKEAEKRADASKEALIAALGDAECGVWSGGQFTFYEQARAGYTVHDTTFRVLRHKAPKGAKRRERIGA